MVSSLLRARRAHEACARERAAAEEWTGRRGSREDRLLLGTSPQAILRLAGSVTMRPGGRHERTSRGAARDSSCRSSIMNLMENQQASQSAEGQAKIVTLCGSTKFEAEFSEVNQRLTMEGCVVISLGMFSLPELADYDWTADSSDLKGRLGRVHFQNIRMADEVYIVDPAGYVGESTRREI